MAFWGVDSANQATYVTNNQQLLNYVTAQLGKPDFWGRYIGGGYSLTSSEISYLHNDSVPILVIYNGASSASMSTQQQGIDDANKAINAAVALGMDKADHMLTIYLDIEASWSPTADYIRGWSHGIWACSYSFLPGMYCNTAPSNAFVTAYCAAKQGNTEVSLTSLYTTQPQTTCTTKATAPAWAPTVPSCVGGEDYGVQVWQYKIVCLSGLVDLDEMTDYALQHAF